MIHIPAIIHKLPAKKMIRIKNEKASTTKHKLQFKAAALCHNSNVQ